MDLDKQENKLKKNIKNKIGILGGTFDPPHKGHVKISIEAKKLYGLKNIIWSVTKKSPFNLIDPLKPLTLNLANSAVTIILSRKEGNRFKKLLGDFFNAS